MYAQGRVRARSAGSPPITGLHLWLNFDWESYLNDYRPERERKLNVAYIPVT